MAISPPLSPLSPAPAVAAQPPLLTPQTDQAVAPANSIERDGRADSSTSEQARQPSADAIQEINDTMRAWATNLRFEIDPDAQRLVVSVVDTESGDVLRTVPNEATIRIAKMVVGLQGKMVDTSA